MDEPQPGAVRFVAAGLPDKDRADQWRERLKTVLAPVCDIMAEAQRDGFRIGWGLGNDPLGRPVILQIEIVKVL